jgi:hypothetical protein
LFGDWVDYYHGVLSLEDITTHDRLLSILQFGGDAIIVAVHGGETLEPTPKLGREGVVCADGLSQSATELHRQVFEVVR